MGKLTPRQAAFCREYAKDFVGCDAAIRAGYSRSNARPMACRLLQKPHVSKEIARITVRACEKADVTIARVVTELSRIAFSRSADVATVKRGRLRVRDTDALNEDQLAAVAEVAETVNGIKIRQYDKVKALELLGRYKAMFVDRHEVTGSTEMVVVEKLIDAHGDPSTSGADGVSPQ